MADVIFYGKPACGGNARQRAHLEASGHHVAVRDLLTEPWTAERLRSFFGDKPVAAWINPASPRVKTGEIAPVTLDAETALTLMIADTGLIRRPLLESGGRREAGWDAALIEAWLGLTPERAAPGEACPRHAKGDGSCSGR